MHPAYRSFCAYLLLALFVLIQGCTPAPSVKQPPQQEFGPELARAEALEKQADYGAAALAYPQLARRSTPPQLQDFLLRAAVNLFRNGDLTGARRLLAGIDTRGLRDEYQFRKRLQGSEIALAQGRGDDALAQHAVSPPPDSPAPQRRRYHRARAEALRQTGNLLESARELSELDPLVEEPEQRLDNQLAIIQRLTRLTPKALEFLQLGTPDDFSGWLALALDLQTSLRFPAELEERLDAWRQHYPNHPALPGLLERYLNTREARYQRLRKIAVLLPQSGKFAKVADALRDGLMAAYYGLAAERRPLLHFYDSTDPADTWPQYQRAVGEGADLILGPLHKEAVAQIAQAGTLKIPVLALNQIPLDTPPSEDFFLFGLSPEDEARQVAEKAWLDGFAQANVLTPENSWGDRIYRSFRDRWESLGGTVSEHQTYDLKSNDFSEPIRTLLNLDESDERRRDLERILGQKLKFEPRRRRDVDFILLAAHTQKARQIRPQLQFHFAADLPVYTTSHVNSGTRDPEQDLDLEGLRFPDMPWLLAEEGDTKLSRQTYFQAMPGSDMRYARFYAMGIDALNLLPELLRLSSDTEEVFDGKTGTLHLDAEHRIRRRLIWAQFRRGGVKVLGYAPRLPTEVDQDPGEEVELAPVDMPGNADPPNPREVEPPSERPTSR